MLNDREKEKKGKMKIKKTKILKSETKKQYEDLKTRISKEREIGKKGRVE